MEYEIKVWKNSKNMPDIEPQKAKGKIAKAVDKTSDVIKNPAAVLNKPKKKGTKPDILIDKDAGGEGVIKSVKISYSTDKVDKGEVKQLVRSLKIEIKGNLYLPLEEGLTDKILNKITKADSKEEENKLRNTLLMSEWAQVKPEEDGTKQYYRGIIIKIMTPGGDFRLITAKNVYVDSYKENYQEGEYGTFEMSLVERIDSNEQFKVDGIGYVEESTLDKVAKGVEKAAKVVAGLAVAAQAGKVITETVEKYTGETAVTRWMKYGFDSVGTVSGVTSDAADIAKGKKDWKGVSETVSKDIQNLEKQTKKGVDTKEAIPLEQMEKMYLSWIQADPKAYEKYKKMSYDEKYAALKKASKDMQARAGVTKDMEQEEYNYYKRENEKEKAAAKEEKKRKKEEEKKRKKEEEKKKKEEEKRKKEEEEKRKKEEEEKRKKEEEEKRKKEEEEKRKKEEEEKRKKENNPPAPPSNTDTGIMPSDTTIPPSNNNASHSGTNSEGNQTLNDKINSAANKKNGNGDSNAS